MKILLIAGHGQGDPGAVGNGYREAELTRNTVIKIADYLRRYCEVEIFDLTKDMYQYLTSGGTYNFGGYNYVFEVHFNAFNGNAYGTEILVHQNEKSVSVEEKILEKMSALGFFNRGIKKRSDLRVMNTVKKIYGVSHALMEVCFIDNKNDMEKYIKNSDLVAGAIASGIVEGFSLTREEKESFSASSGLLNNQPSEEKGLTSANDLIWELSQWIEINDVPGAVAALQKAKDEENPLYWIVYKIANK